MEWKLNDCLALFGVNICVDKLTSLRQDPLRGNGNRKRKIHFARGRHFRNTFILTCLKKKLRACTALNCKHSPRERNAVSCGHNTLTWGVWFQLFPVFRQGRRWHDSVFFIYFHRQMSAWKSLPYFSVDSFVYLSNCHWHSCFAVCVFYFVLHPLLCNPMPWRSSIDVKFVFFIRFQIRCEEKGPVKMCNTHKAKSRFRPRYMYLQVSILEKFRLRSRFYDFPDMCLAS